MKLMTLIIGLALSQLAFADVCELSLHSAPYKPGTAVSSFVTVQCDNSNLSSGTTEFETREAAAESYKKIAATWSLMNWKMTTCRSLEFGLKYACSFESTK